MSDPAGLKEKFVEFVDELSDAELTGMCEARNNINLSGEVFYAFPRGHRDDTAITVYDSDGQADMPISPSKLREKLLKDADCLLERAYFEAN